MVSYSSSQKTIMSLIMAAGELFARHGVEAVTTRKIAEKAKENIGNIHYHFGGKDGLVDAVLEFSCSLWREDPFGKFLKKNHFLMSDPEGREALIKSMIDMFFDIIFSDEKPFWCGTLIFQVLQRNLEVSSKVMKRIITPSTQAFVSIYNEITGNHDFDDAYCWYLNVISPAVICSMNQNTIEKIRPKGAISSEFISKLKSIALKNAMAGLGIKNKNP